MARFVSLVGISENLLEEAIDCRVSASIRILGDGLFFLRAQYGIGDRFPIFVGFETRGRRRRGWREGGQSGFWPGLNDTFADVQDKLTLCLRGIARQFVPFPLRLERFDEPDLDLNSPDGVVALLGFEVALERF